jgi:DNA invertase Pin-like site-specific DNA recombinase
MRAIIPDTEARRRKAERNAIAEQTRKARDRAAEGRYATNYTKAGVRSSNEQKRDTARLMRSMGRSCREIGAELGVSYQTVIRWTRYR